MRLRVSYLVRKHPPSTCTSTVLEGKVDYMRVLGGVGG